MKEIQLKRCKIKFWEKKPKTYVRVLFSYNHRHGQYFTGQDRVIVFKFGDLLKMN